MKRLLVGGNFGDEKKSTVAKKLADRIYADIFNGGTLKQLESAKRMVEDYDLIVWMPNISNEIAKDYPTKKIGSILICSKVLRDERNIGDAVSRIFKMNANAVVAISTKEENSFTFKLVDALGNLWIETKSINELGSAIENFAYWSKESKRKSTTKISLEDRIDIWFHTKKPNRDVVDWFDTLSDEEKIKYLDSDKIKVNQDFCDIVKLIAQKVENERGGRYFGNASTRCSYMFPSINIGSGILVSGRNMPKEFLKPEDFVFVYEQNGIIYYDGAKPSVDTPVQIELYKMLPNITHIIHGHAYIKGDNVLETEHYYPCGDLREVDAIKESLTKYALSIGSKEPIEWMNNLSYFCMNLKNHGFLICCNKQYLTKELFENLVYEYRPLEEPITQ